MRFKTARQAIIDAHNCRLSSVSDFSGMGEAVVLLRAHCPQCRSAGLADVGERAVLRRGERWVNQGRGVASDAGVAVARALTLKQFWHCRRCDIYTANPLHMRPKGSAPASSGAWAGNDFRIWNGLQVEKVLRVVDGLPPECQLWVKYAYVDGGDVMALESGLLEWLVDALDKAPPVDITGLGALAKALKLLLMVLQDSRRVEMCGQNLYSSAEMARRIGVDRREFVPGRKWGRFCDGARRQVDILIGGSLGPVARLVDEMREKERAA